MTGKVYLVGAGPGDPELLTVKAVRILGAADVVLHDALVSAEILALVSPRAEVIHIGKRCRQKLLTQEEINSLLVHYAQTRTMVVRLKGGDPLLFGRAGEEIDALRTAGVPFEIVSGVTSGLASAAAAGVSLTDRRIASQVLFTTAHREPGRVALDWAGLVGSDTTVVVYMPGREYAQLSASLLEAGLDAQTPCLVTSCASLPAQQLKRTTVGGLGDEIGLPAPSLLIIGWVADPAAVFAANALWNKPGKSQAAEENVF
ncbi:MAG: uroporphyrinogen-III C-methyltransferase [Terriglobales bacterium]